MGTTELMLGVTLQWTSIPSRVEENTPSHFMRMLLKADISSVLMDHLARMQTSPPT